MVIREDPSVSSILTLGPDPGCRGCRRFVSGVNTRRAVFGAQFVGLQSREPRPNGNNPPSTRSFWDPPLKILFIKDQNLRQDAKDFMALARSNVAVDFQIVDLSLNRQMSVELPYLLSSFSTEWVRRGDQAWRQ